MPLDQGTERPVTVGARLKRLLKRLLALSVVAALAGAVIYASLLPSVQRQFSGRRGARMGATVPVTIAQARTSDVPLYLEGVGSAKARNTVTVRPQIDGRILSIAFKEGQDVKRGDVLAKIDPATYQAQLDQAAAKKVLDETELANAKRDLARYAKLGANIIAQKTIDTQDALVDKLTAQIKLDDAAIANAKAVLDYTTIVAPIDGRTGIRMVDQGNLVRASDAGIVVITELRPINVLFTLPQQQLGEVQKAQSKGVLAVEALDSDGKSTLDRGVLQVVDNQVDPTTGTVRMKAEFPNAKLQLWPGQFVNVRLLIDTLDQVVVIPTPAVQRGPSGTFAYVLQPDNHVSMRPIAVAHQFETQAVIAHGIAAGDKVVTTGFSRLKDGARVSIPAPEAQPATPKSGEPSAGATPGPRSKRRAACAADVKRFCAEVEGRSAIAACLKASATQLSDTCKAALKGAADARERRMRKAEGAGSP
ncbi:MAG TPA: efflux RND transporter periplasmic adaptor subunit [Hyphomicrobiaceae bacterium]|nr:efflux RND transporter periplasmic adaptor subunit [Hyphomicrobiaceae bacterium]